MLDVDFRKLSNDIYDIKITVDSISYNNLGTFSKEEKNTFCKELIEQLENNITD